MVTIVQNILLLSLVTVSAYTDIRYRKVFNKFTISSIVAGLIIFIVSHGLLGLYVSAVGLLVGGLILIIPFAVGGMGAGDVKLLAAIGSIKGWQFVLIAFVYAAVLGGLYAIAYSLYVRGIKKSLILFISTVFAPLFSITYSLTRIHFVGNLSAKLQRVSASAKKLYVPYAVPIAIGCILVLMELNPFTAFISSLR